MGVGRYQPIRQHGCARTHPGLTVLPSGITSRIPARFSGPVPPRTYRLDSKSAPAIDDRPISTSWDRFGDVETEKEVFDVRERGPAREAEARA